MMSILEYSQDVSKSLDDIFKLCDKLGIVYELNKHSETYTTLRRKESEL